MKMSLAREIRIHIDRLRATGRPLIGDAYCCEGGAARGYQRAGFAVFGIDKANTGRRYLAGLTPGAAAFVQCDALEFISLFGRRFDAWHGSPPCQPYSRATCGNLAARGNYDALIPATRERFELTGRPWIIENVEHARAELVRPVLLCGRMFGLSATDEDGEPLVMDRHRLFESNIPLKAPPHPEHAADARTIAGVYGGARRAPRPLIGATPAPWQDRYAARVVRKGGYVPRSRRVQETLLGVDGMTLNGMNECIPPAYSEYLGAQLMWQAAMR